MIEITKDQCTRMLVWDNEESIAIEADVYAKVDGHICRYKTLNNGSWANAKPLPEEKPMTALDVMWWAGVRKVTRQVNGDRFTCVSAFSSLSDISKYEFNELTRENGETKLKHSEWLPFTLTNCKMG